LLEAQTNYFYFFNISATMPRQGGQVLLEQSDMRCAFNMAKMAKAGFSLTDIEETEYSTKKPRAEVQEGKKPGVEFTGCRMVKTAVERHPAIASSKRHS
jgi:hypothetical protein